MTGTRQYHGPSSLKDGWNQIARDFDRALARLFVPDYERVVLQEVKEQSWIIPGAARKPAGRCYLNISDLARKSDLYRQALGDAVQMLIARKILIESEDGGLTINKDYRQWVRPATGNRPERPLFSEKALRFIEEAKDLVRAASFWEPPPQSADRAPKKPKPTAEKPMPLFGQKGLADETAVFNAPHTAVFNAPHTAVSVSEYRGIHPPIEERAGDETESLESEREKDPPNPPGGGGGGVGIPSGRTEVQAEARSPEAEGSAEPERLGGLEIPGSDSAAATKLGRTVARLHGADLGDAARGWCDYYPAEWIEATVRLNMTGRSGKKAVANIRYLQVILERYRAQGSCDAIKPPRKPEPEVEYLRDLTKDLEYQALLAQGRANEAKYPPPKPRPKPAPPRKPDPLFVTIPEDPIVRARRMEAFIAMANRVRMAGPRALDGDSY